MEYLIYISTAKKLLSQAELTEILEVSRRNNERNNLTGVLLYSEGTFIQLLEGAPEPLHKTYQAIIKDPRHKNIIKLTEGHLDEPSFPDWTMAFRALNTAELESIEGYLNPSKVVFDDEDKHPGITMIKNFAASTK